LFAEPLTPRLRAAAPYLVHLAAGSAQSREMLSRGRDHWGILIAAPAHVSTQQLRLHFKKMLWVQDQHAQSLYFRFYDPRVLGIYLSSCSGDERQAFFGPVETMYSIEDGRLRHFRATHGDGEI
jgi:hypothetical protein